MGSPVRDLPVRQPAGGEDRFGPLADGTPYDVLFVFDDKGYNFEPSEIMAAYGLGQIEKRDEFNRRRQDAFDAIDAAFAKHDDKIVHPRTTADVEITWMRYPFLLADGIDRVAVQEHFLSRNIPTRMVCTDASERYATRSGIDVALLDWYVAFATWRTAIVLRQLHIRYLSGHTTDQRYAGYGAAIAQYADRARELVS